MGAALSLTKLRGVDLNFENFCIVKGIRLRQVWEEFGKNLVACGALVYILKSKLFAATKEKG